MVKSTGFAKINQAEIYYEMAGTGTPFIMIHAGVADSRQWNQAFEYFSLQYQVLRYDTRGYGKSQPVAGEYREFDDLISLLDVLKIKSPFIVMGCSMGGGLAMDFALAYPERVQALIMVGSAPSGLNLDVEFNPLEADAERAYEAKNWELLAELETQMFFDGMGRSPEQVDQTMRGLALEMSLNALKMRASGIAKRLPNTDSPAANRLNELVMPVLVVYGQFDEPYILAAADYMAEHIKSVKKVMMADAAHLPNMDHPHQFQEIVESFLSKIK